MQVLPTYLQMRTYLKDRNSVISGLSFLTIQLYLVLPARMFPYPLYHWKKERDQRQKEGRSQVTEQVLFLWWTLWCTIILWSRTFSINWPRLKADSFRGSISPSSRALSWRGSVRIALLSGFTDHKWGAWVTWLGVLELWWGHYIQKQRSTGVCQGLLWTNGRQEGLEARAAASAPPWHLSQSV